MNRIPVVKADVWWDNPVGTPLQYQQLLNTVVQMYHNRTPETTADNSNKGCWRSNIDLSNYGWLNDIIYKNFKRLLNYYNPDGYFNKHAYNKQEDIPTEVMMNAWVNVNDPMSRNVMHSHSGSIISGVYYLQATDTGEIIFYPNHILNDGGVACNSRAPYCDPITISPTDNSLVMFPAWLPHDIAANPSTKQRINIAFNISRI